MTSGHFAGELVSSARMAALPGKLNVVAAGAAPGNAPAITLTKAASATPITAGGAASTAAMIGSYAAAGTGIPYTLLISAFSRVSIFASTSFATSPASGV